MSKTIKPSEIIETTSQKTEIIQPAEITFDFTRVDLFDFLDLIEVSAQKQAGKETSPEETVKFVRMLRAAFVSSSRPLTVADFNDTITAFWKSAELFKNPND